MGYALAVAARLDRRAQIVQAAFDLIATRGLEGLRFGDVARAVGINNGTLLYYFASKDALIKAVGDYVVDQYRQTGGPARPAEDPRTPLADLRWEFTDASARLRDAVGIVYLELLARAQRDPAVAALLADIDAAWRGWLARLLEAGRQDGSLRADLDVGLATSLIMSAIRGVGMQALVPPASADLAPTLNELGELILRWLAAPP
jgi:AcrR family transcriptional regulator